MDNETLQRLVERLSSDTDLARRCRTAATLDEVAAVVSEAGFEVTAGELATLTTGSQGDLSETELESVAGGIGVVTPDYDQVW